MTGCSSDMMLAQLLDEQLDEAEKASIVDHVESCTSCQERLKSLTCECSRLASIDDLRDPSRDPWPTMFQNIAGSGTTGELTEGLSRLADCLTYGRASDAEFPAVDGYQIFSELGHGGMGVVYKAFQTRLSRFVALKMIRAGSLAKPEDLARFKIEAESVAKQRHPNIIQIFDIGEVAGLPYVALELLEGGSLDEFLGGRPQPGDAAARLSATLARAIHAAHLGGIIHRDLKPSNVLFGADGTPKITDFGLAKRLEEDGYTETGQVLGSPSYIPPEQAQGRAKEVGPAADVYALGAVLYEMLTGRPPFKGKTPVETVMQVLNDDPVPPSQLAPQTPRDLETICLKCLSKDPQKRYASALALAEDLDRFLDARPIYAQRLPVVERGVRWARRRPIRSLLMALGAIFLAVGAGAWVRSEVNLKLTRDWVRAATIAAENQMIDGDFPIEELARLATITERDLRLAVEHARIKYLISKGRTGAEHQAAWDRAKKAYQEFFELHDLTLFQDTQLKGLDPSENVAAVRKLAKDALAVFAADEDFDEDWTLGALHPSLTDSERAEVTRGCYEMLLVYAESIAYPLSGENAVKQAERALHVLDAATALRREPTHAFHVIRAACFKRAENQTAADAEKEIADRILPEGAFDHFLTGLDLYKRGYVARAKHHFAETLRVQGNHFWAQCLLANCELDRRESAESAKGHLTACLQTHRELPWLYLLRGYASGQIGEQAMKAAQKAMKAAKTSKDRERAQKQIDAATEHFRDAEADYAEAQKRDPERRFQYALLVNRGLVRFQSQQFDGAFDDARAAIALAPRQLLAHVTLAQVHRQRHEMDLALQELDRAIALEPKLAKLYRTRAQWNLERNHPTPQIRASVLADLERAIQLGVPDSVEQAEDFAQTGRVLLMEKQYQKALDACEKALAIDPKIASVHRPRVSALLELGRADEAIAACDAYLRSGFRSAELLGLRGLAKIKGNRLGSAIDDYTLALAIEPLSTNIRSRRGWAYLVSGAIQLALDDFEEVVRIDPSNGDAHSGRGLALAAFGRYREAVASAEESLRHVDSESPLQYRAARVMAMASGLPSNSTRGRGPASPELATLYQARAVELLGQAVDRIPLNRRAAFWHDVVDSDPAFASIRRLAAYTRISSELALRSTP
jgi:serine/threonine protein kinase/tetratricopeptide (TPR) repeat protein